MINRLMNKKKKRIWPWFLLAVAIIAYLAMSATFRRYPAYNGVVVDATTNKPLGEAVILAIYTTQSILDEANRNFLAAEESISRADGTFILPRKMNYAFWPPLTRFMESPQIYVLARGYAGFPCDPKAANSRQLDPSSLRYRYTLQKRDGSGPDDKLKMVCQPKDLDGFEIKYYPEYMKIVESNREILGLPIIEAVK
jgi:hypothetical protein